MEHDTMRYEDILRQREKTSKSTLKIRSGETRVGAILDALGGARAWYLSDGTYMEFNTSPEGWKSIIGRILFGRHRDQEAMNIPHMIHTVCTLCERALRKYPDGIHHILIERPKWRDNLWAGVFEWECNLYICCIEWNGQTIHDDIRRCRDAILYKIPVLNCPPQCYLARYRTGMATLEA